MGGLDDLLGGKGSSLGDLIGGLAGGGSGGAGLDDLIGKLAGGNSGPGGLGGMLTSLLPAVGGLLEGGGLQKVLAGLEQGGHGAETASWLSSGANRSISGADIEAALGHDQVEQLAGKLGVSADDAANAVAGALPEIVDRLSPDGHLPDEQTLDTELRKLLGG